MSEGGWDVVEDLCVWGGGVGGWVYVCVGVCIFVFVNQADGSENNSFQTINLTIQPQTSILN